MIGLLRGKLIVKKTPDLLLDVGGVGYEIQAPLSTFYKLPKIGEEVTLFTHFIIRETAQLLYGFYTETEKAIFKEIIKVSGVGPKLGIAMLSGMETKDLLHCIRDRNSDRLVKVPGVGKKTAERLVIELQGKLDKHFASSEQFSNIVITSTDADDSQNNLKFPEETDVIGDAISALLALGYKEQEAKRMIAKVSETDVAANVTDAESMIRLALQTMGK